MAEYSAEDKSILRDEVDLRTSHIKLIAKNMAAGMFENNRVYYEEHFSVDESGTSVGWRQGSDAMIKSESDMQLLASCDKSLLEQTPSWKPVFGLQTTIWRKNLNTNKWAGIDFNVTSVQMNSYLDPLGAEITDPVWIFTYVPASPTEPQPEWSLVGRFAYTVNGIEFAGNGVGDD